LPLDGEGPVNVLMLEAFAKVLCLELSKYSLLLFLNHDLIKYPLQCSLECQNLKGIVTLPAVFPEGPDTMDKILFLLINQQMKH
jgi:hypothetical protein